MESAPATTAAQVCLTCKLRKKGCDKLLPCCTYCKRRDLQCRYLQAAITPPSPAPTDVVVAQRLSSGAWYPSPPSPRTFGSDCRSSSQTICDQVCQTIGEVGQHADVLAHCYFRGLHLWLPFLSRDSLHRSVVLFPASGDAEFSLLLLCVCLIGYIPANEAAFRLDELYQRAKATAALLQLYPVASLNSIRAFTLLAIYEYCTQRVYDALNTLTVAIRMSYSIHLEERGQGHPHAHDEPRTDVDVYQSEANNLWWTLVICERLFVLETSNPWQPLLTPLPSEVHSLPYSSATPPKVTSRASIASFDSVDGFGRAAQAAVLMDRVLNFVRNLDSNAAFLGQTVLTDLTCIDADIQSFLSLVLEQCHGVWGQFCCSVATAMKAMFLLHGEVLDKMSRHVSESQLRASRAALDTVTRIMIDISRSHVVVDVDLSITGALPPTCIYNLRSSIRCLHETLEQRSEVLEEVEILCTFLKIFEQRWPPKKVDRSKWR